MVAGALHQALALAEHAEQQHAAHCHVPASRVCDECAWHMTEVEQARGNVRKAVEALGAGTRHAALLDYARRCEVEAATEPDANEAAELRADALAARARALQLEREAGA